jgi:hypothetical protein
MELRLPCPRALALQDLPGEILMRIARMTPHPCAVLMKDLFEDGWFNWLERWEEQRFQLRMHAAEFAYDRDCRKRCRDPIEELALERRASLKYMGVYEDEIDYERKRRR